MMKQPFRRFKQKRLSLRSAQSFLVLFVFTWILVIDATIRLRQRIERFHLFIGQFEVEDIEVLFLVQLARRAGEWNDTELDMPAQDDLRDTLAFLFGELGDLLVMNDRAGATERAPCLCDDATLLSLLRYSTFLGNETFECEVNVETL